MVKMKQKKHKSKSKDKRRESEKRNRRKHSKKKYNESNSSSGICEDEQEWVEKPISLSAFQKINAHTTEKEQKPAKREDWMDMKSVFPCIFKEKGTKDSNCSKDKNMSDLDQFGQSDRELNPYWKNGGNGLPEESSPEAKHVMDVHWLKKSLQRAEEQATNENRSLKEVAAERWGSLEVIQSMISEAESAPVTGKSRYILNSFKETKYKNKFGNIEKYGSNGPSSNFTRVYNSIRNEHKKSDNSEYINKQKQGSKKLMNDDCFINTSHKASYSGKKNWQKTSMHERTEENQAYLCKSISENSYHDNVNDIKLQEIEPLTEAEMNKLGAKIVKAEIMGDNVLAEKLKVQLLQARDTIKSSNLHNTEQIQQVILTHTDAKGVTRPLVRARQYTESSKNTKRKNVETHVSGKKVRNYFDDDKYSLQQLFQREKGRSTTEDDAAFIKIASKTMDMDEVFEEHITNVKLDAKQDKIDRARAMKEHTSLSKSVDSCRWCIDSRYMLKHMIISMDSEVSLSLPEYTSLTVGHCIISPIQHIACQLQLDENVWEKLKLYKKALYKMFMDQNQYPVFYETYKSRYKFSHMQLVCVPLPEKVGELVQIYFKKALLECETEWSMNKKVLDLDRKDIRQVIPNGLSYFMVEFEKNKGYAHIIEDEQMFPQNFAQEIIGGMLDLDHDIWRKPRKENFEQQHEKVLTFSKMWQKYECEVKYK